MTYEEIINKTINNEGNHCRASGDVYISLTNMEGFVDGLKNCNDTISILLTPYLVNIEEDALYELHYYEFELEMLDVDHSYYIEYMENNSLPKEIVNNIKPKAIVAKSDKAFLIESLQNYLKSMRKMVFEEDRKSDIRLQDAGLYYQIF